MAERRRDDQRGGPPRIFFVRVRTERDMLPNGLSVPLQGCHVEADRRSDGLLSANRQRYDAYEEEQRWRAYFHSPFLHAGPQIASKG